MCVKYKTKMWKTGGSYVITVPGDFIKYGLIPIDKELEIEMEPVQQSTQNDADVVCPGLISSGFESSSVLFGEAL